MRQSSVAPNQTHTARYLKVKNITNGETGGGGSLAGVIILVMVSRGFGFELVITDNKLLPINAIIMGTSYKD